MKSKTGKAAPVAKKAGGPTGAEIAKALGVSASRVTRLAQAGMPTGSIAAAIAWRDQAARASGRRGPKPSAHIAAKVARKPASVPALDDGDDTPRAEPVVDATYDSVEELRKRIAKQTTMATKTQKVFEAAMSSGDIQAAKQAGEMNNAAQKILIVLEAELRRREVEAGTLLTVETAFDAHRALLAEIRQFIDSGETDFAGAANPDNPARAIKAWRRMRDTLYAKLQRTTDDV